jgi:hypothetical protein
LNIGINIGICGNLNLFFGNGGKKFKLLELIGINKQIKMKNQWSKPTVLKSYKYKGFIIEHWEQSFSTNYSIVWHHEFVGFKNGKRVTSELNQHRRYTDCINEIKNIIKNG